MTEEKLKAANQLTDKIKILQSKLETLEIGKAELEMVIRFYGTAYDVGGISETDKAFICDYLGKRFHDELIDAIKQLDEL